LLLPLQPTNESSITQRTPIAILFERRVSLDIAEPANSTHPSDSSSNIGSANTIDTTCSSFLWKDYAQ
jgi:hypothetical protein